VKREMVTGNNTT